MLQHSPETTRHARVNDRRLGDHALDVVNHYRDAAEENFRVEHLDVEFPFLAAELGGAAYYLADATENRAGTFKWRGAIVATDHLQELHIQHVLAHSAGNHVLGIALASDLLQIRAQISVPTSAPPEKSTGPQRLSSQVAVRREGTTFDETTAICKARGDYRDPGFVHSFDNEYVIAGQGTLFDDIIAAQPNVGRIGVAVGGGGLICSIANRRDQLNLTNQIEVVGVQVEGSNWLSNSVAHHRRMEADAPNQRFGGVAVGKGGKHPFRMLVSSENTTVMTVPTEVIEEFITDYEYSRSETLRQDVVPLEPTALIAAAGLTRCGYIGSEVTVIVGTGRNAPLYPRPASRTLRAWQGGRLS